MKELLGRPAITLLAEDDSADVDLTRRALKECKIRTELYVVNDGEEFLDYLYHRGEYEDSSTSPRPDLILLDLNMPKIDGRQALETMRSDPNLPRIPVVVLTTSQEPRDISRSYELGCNSYISKPPSGKEFMDVMLALAQYWFQIVVLAPNESGARA
jgi:CheY-like chemotaxis protein